MNGGVSPPRGYQNFADISSINASADRTQERSLYFELLGGFRQSLGFGKGGQNQPFERGSGGHVKESTTSAFDFTSLIAEYPRMIQNSEAARQENTNRSSAYEGN
jgi:hypothetical protein